MDQIVDPKLSRKGGFSKKLMERTLQMALKCLHEDANARPVITEVVTSLDYIIEYSLRGRIHRRGGRVDTNRAGTSTEMDVIEEESDILERKRVLEEALSWADKCRRGSQPTATPSPNLKS
ncbi:serine/threonine-protein kinase CDG1-like [Capsella rubella]|nr:serine/threonine-protein kinase CDG1-like [Capsella rubella]